jgi:hypothetical protein
MKNMQNKLNSQHEGRKGLATFVVSALSTETKAGFGVYAPITTKLRSVPNI